MIHKVFQDTLKEVSEKKSRKKENLAALCFLLCINLRVVGERWGKECSYTNIMGWKFCRISIERKMP